MMEKLCLSKRSRINRRRRRRRGNFIEDATEFAEGAADARESNGYSVNRISASRSLGKLQTSVFL